LFYMLGAYVGLVTLSALGVQSGLPVWETRVSMASYRYSSHGYFDPAQAFALHDQILHGRDARGRMTWHPRNRLVINASQPLPGSLGHLGLSFSSQDHWNQPGRETQYQFSYHRRIRKASAGLSASRTFNVLQQRWDNQVMLNVSLPLGGRLPLHSQTHYTHRAHGQALQTSVSGIFGDARQFSARAFVAAREQGRGQQYSGGLGGNWSAAKATISANLSASSGGQRQYGVNVSGGVVAFADGVLFTPELSETVGIIEARHAQGARLTQRAGKVHLNRRGQALASGLRPYRENTVGLDPKGLSTDVALATTLKKVAPSAGAVVLLAFETERSHSFLLKGQRADGSVLPFGASVFDDEGRHVGHVSQGGLALLRVKNHQGQLNVRWGAGREQSCRFEYSISEHNQVDNVDYASGLPRRQALCAAQSQD